MALLAARDDTLIKVTSQDASQSKADVLGKLVAYCSDQVQWLADLIYNTAQQTLTIQYNHIIATTNTTPCTTMV